jgi:hypothetical protein
VSARTRPWRARSRGPLVAVAVLLAAAIVIAVAFAATGSSDSGTAARPAPDVSPRRIAIGATNAFDLSHGSRLALTVRVPKADRPVVRVAIVKAGRGPEPAAAPQPVGSATLRHLSITPSAQAARALGGCDAARLTVTVADHAGGVLARRSEQLAPVPPACGRFFNARSVWNAPIPAVAPLDPDSRTLVAELRRQVDDGFAKDYPPTINTVNYSAPVYTVGAHQRRVPVALVGGRAAYGQALAAQLAQGVPIPRGARVAWGNDHHLVVWQPSSDTMWELWSADDSTGKWTAQWGGRMNHVSSSPGYFADPSGIQPGATATSLPLIGGLITQADLARGEIDHALAMSIPDSRYAVWAHPAQRSDGNDRDPAAIPEGIRFRLDPSIDVDSLHLPHFTAMLAKAAQRYGIYVRDTSPTVTLYGQDPVTMKTNPWPQAIQPSAAEVLRAFPWDRLQAMPMSLWTYSGQRVTR